MSNTDTEIKKLKSALVTLILVTRHARNVGFTVSLEQLRSEAVMAEREIESVLGTTELEKLNKKAFKK